MLSDDAIENLIQQLINRQENINNYVVQTIAKRIREIGTLLPSDIHKLEQLLKSGDDVRKINAEIARLTNLQVKEIKKIIKTVALDSYIDAKPFYDYRYKSFIPFNKNTQLQNVVNSIANQTANSYVNLSKAQAFMIRDLKNPDKLIPTSISKTYHTVIDEAVQIVQSGTLDYNTAIRRTMEQLNSSGIRYVTYQTKSGRIFNQRLDTAVRRNILDGIRAVNQGVQDEVGKQIKADGKELTVHANSAPDHEPIQGHQFTNEEYDKLQNGIAFKDVDGEKFSPIDRAIGTLNCRHFAYSIIIGVSKPNYTKEQLKEFIKRNREGYTLSNGKHLTMYECTQHQRKLETLIRRTRDGIKMADTSGDEFLTKKYKSRLTRLMKTYQSFSKACKLPMKLRNLGI